MTAYRTVEEPYTTSFEATVESVDGREVILDATYFYAEGGGQPADRGTVGGHPVADVQKTGGAVVHVLAAEPEFAPGETVAGEVDEAFRTYCMRAHTASHVVYGAGRRVLDGLGYGGFDIGEEKVRVDFETATTIDDDVLVELERLANRTVWDSRPVTWEELPREEAVALDGIAFNDATEEGVMADADAVRVVTVEGWDVGACGGTHVRNTREIGPVSVLDRSNPGEGLTRVEFAVGPTAIEARAAECRRALAAASTLDVGVHELDEAATRLRNEVADLESGLSDLKAEVLDARLADLRRIEREDGEWLVGAIEGFGPNEVGESAQDLAGESADVVAVTGAQGAAFVVVATDGKVPAGDVVGAVTDEFGGGGGGGPTFAQGGGMDADPEAVARYLEDA